MRCTSSVRPSPRSPTSTVDRHPGAASGPGARQPHHRRRGEHHARRQPQPRPAAASRPPSAVPSSARTVTVVDTRCLPRPGLRGRRGRRPPPWRGRGRRAGRRGRAAPRPPPAVDVSTVTVACGGQRREPGHDVGVQLRVAGGQDAAAEHDRVRRVQQRQPAGGDPVPAPRSRRRACATTRTATASPAAATANSTRTARRGARAGRSPRCRRDADRLHRRQAEVVGDGVGAARSAGPRPSSPRAACQSASSAEVVPAAPVAGDRAERREPGGAPVGAAADAVDAGAADDGDRVRRVGAGAQQREQCRCRRVARRPSRARRPPCVSRSDLDRQVGAGEVDRRPGRRQRRRQRRPRRRAWPTSAVEQRQRAGQADDCAATMPGPRTKPRTSPVVGRRATTSVLELPPSTRDEERASSGPREVRARWRRAAVGQRVGAASCWPTSGWASSAR